ncbi:MAG: hypothetical protein IJ106_16325, partial [Parasporobacterium sp.]|nr:hypothetical protein [Parasporobacterium sp.]
FLFLKRPYYALVKSEKIYYYGPKIVLSGHEIPIYYNFSDKDTENGTKKGAENDGTNDRTDP